MYIYRYTTRSEAERRTISETVDRGSRRRSLASELERTPSPFQLPTYLRFADDILVIAETMRDLITMLNGLNTFSE